VTDIAFLGQYDDDDDGDDDDATGDMT